MANDLRAVMARAGSSDVPYVDPNFPDRPLILRIARPKACDADTPVLFVHHGVNRNGYDYRDFWLPLVDRAGVLVIAPEFSAEHYPKTPWYNFGNLRDEQGGLRPREQWTYGIVGRLFESLRREGITRRTGYGLFGHSAGGQFVHRMMSLGFRDKVVTAVTANAGTYAMPDLDIDFPYGLGGIGLDEAALKAFLRFPLIVMAGTADIDNTSEHFPKEEEAMRQGGTRYERAHRYIANARAAAARLGVECAWKIIDVPDVGHDGERMSAAAAPVLAPILGA
ncbi:MAG TPA: alpha/beta hydrolase [Reyranella sp.]|jgi:poly(3-hydroxybutyrate) depolymerase|nr:alpha/beta hydrolase [Reyranella sp.]